MSDAEGKADELREEIEQTQEELSATVDAIEERLSPQHFKEQAQETAEQVVAQATEAVHEATIGKVNQMIRSARAAMNRVTGGTRERTTTVVTRAGERVPESACKDTGRRERGRLGPRGRRDRPTGRRDRPTGRRDRPTGRRDRPTGRRDRLFHRSRPRVVDVRAACRAGASGWLAAWSAGCSSAWCWVGRWPSAPTPTPWPQRPCSRRPRRRTSRPTWPLGRAGWSGNVHKGDPRRVLVPPTRRGSSRSPSLPSARQAAVRNRDTIGTCGANIDNLLSIFTAPSGASCAGRRSCTRLGARGRTARSLWPPTPMRWVSARS